MTIITTAPPEISHAQCARRRCQSATEVAAVTDTTIDVINQQVKTILSLLSTSPISVEGEALQTLLSQPGAEQALTEGRHCGLNRALQQLQTVTDQRCTPNDIIHYTESQSRQIIACDIALGEIKREIAAQRTRNVFKVNQFESLTRLSPANQLEGDQKITLHTSYAALWAYMAEAIKGIKKDYIDVFAGLMLKYTEMYEAFNNIVQKAASDCVHPGEDGNYIKFYRQNMVNGYREFEQVRLELENNLGKVKSWEQLTENDKKNWVTTLSPAFNVDEKSGEITFNLEQFSNMPKYPNAQESDSQKVSTASYQAWLATFNAASNALQSNMQSFAQRYSQANSTFDNLNKVLSGAINSLADCAKQVFRSLV
ncbi:IpaD/SipD/SspD family type III secretion system needle tip protein [Tatumella ptyseos]|uniref:IpaD/SipD/SspD family type III secretion system needle tip protein n=1 Tax=Tatumella ptyseos TaxID=82987 RepID=UPI0026EF51C7|nr:IpaD/SipD/SspD family type III secretion system needle tip protein [Tatumella ptyseos]WKX25747.1 IpaD/SipD/SspD family type III secretion system needle tip protein [Tatumella ptyseos]